MAPSAACCRPLPAIGSPRLRAIVPIDRCTMALREAAAITTRPSQPVGMSSRLAMCCCRYFLALSIVPYEVARADTLAASGSQFQVHG